MKKLFAAFLFVLLITGCSGGSYTDVSVDKAKELIDSGEVQVLDVRTPDEFAAGHIPGAKLVPLQVIESMLSELDQDEKYLVVCRSGNRSTQASGILAENGFKNIYNMTGGLNEWKFDLEQ
ncbi:MULTISPECIES: rhodanese-like domain-containing protein [unclassified Mesobacillus]|jgi:rhodanese-related sulfurtransferase|uniref:rhodanese-like domain-containing protein n=1 Tax=unclassified Mesobacillus TaxID=2675270 RepID=UPI00203AA0B7|nr:MULTISPECIES: rhodanese-like domain-containing protein [unclassified Mesobacillus]MCM3122363.1 rhodanese-like domain-containing protein [Mesobacillus sp. MER 33]MCM3232327.1 rhodanese-like domain-containing protein [Mesobacillus sp. MER 48]